MTLREREIDLDPCADETILVPGAMQQHGRMLVDAMLHSVVAYSVEEYGSACLGP